MALNNVHGALLEYGTWDVAYPAARIVGVDISPKRWRSECQDGRSSRLGYVF